MNNETVVKKEKNQPKTVLRRAKRLNDEIGSLRNGDEVGQITQGRFLEITPMLTESGEPVKGNFDQDLHVLSLADLSTGEIKKYWADGGIRGALKMAKVQKDQPIEIEHTGKKKIDEGTVQTYEVYGLEA